MMRRILPLILAVVVGLAADPSAAQDEEEGLTILFATGATTVSGVEAEKLDQAARLFRDGNPVVMIVEGSADTVGDPGTNLDLSIRRARVVADGLADRGIPLDRLQVLGQGNSDLPVTTDDEVSNEQNRSARITWR